MNYRTCNYIFITIHYQIFLPFLWWCDLGHKINHRPDLQYNQ